jgi:SAM-dependent methyltransferase
MLGKIKKRLNKYFDPFGYIVKREVKIFSKSLPTLTSVLDAGAGECQYKYLFEHCDYFSCDLAVGDPDWDYSDLDIVCELTDIPKPNNTFSACICVVVLEHVKEPLLVCKEINRVLKKNGKIFLAVPFCCQEHQAPHDYYRYSSFGIRYILEQANFQDIEIRPWGNDKLTLISILATRFSKKTNKNPLWGIINKVVALFFLILKIIYFNKVDKHPTIPFGWLVSAKKSNF